MVTYSSSVHRFVIAPDNLLYAFFWRIRGYGPLKMLKSKEVMIDLQDVKNVYEHKWGFLILFYSDFSPQFIFLRRLPLEMRDVFYGDNKIKRDEVKFSFNELRYLFYSPAGHYFLFFILSLSSLSALEWIGVRTGISQDLMRLILTVGTMILFALGFIFPWVLSEFQMIKVYKSNLYRTTMLSSLAETRICKILSLVPGIALICAFYLIGLQ